MKTSGGGRGRRRRREPRSHSPRAPSARDRRGRGRGRSGAPRSSRPTRRSAAAPSRSGSWPWRRSARWPWPSRCGATSLTPSPPKARPTSEYSTPSRRDAAREREPSGGRAGPSRLAGAIAYQRLFTSDTFRAMPVLGRDESLDQGAHLRRKGRRALGAAPAFEGRLVHFGAAGPRHRGLAHAIDDKTDHPLPADAWLLVNGEGPTTSRVSLGLALLFVAFAAWNVTAIVRLVRRVRSQDRRRRRRGDRLRVCRGAGEAGRRRGPARAGRAGSRGHHRCGRHPRRADRDARRRRPIAARPHPLRARARDGYAAGPPSSARRRGRTSGTG